MATTPVTMQCMEVWGGNRAINTGVSMPGLDAWVHARPHDDASDGGDIHYLSSCATGNISRMLIADVSGHGSSVAEIAGQLRDLMRRYVNFIDQRKLTVALNDAFAQMTQAGGFATAIVGTYFAPRGQLTITSAGHPSPILYRAATGQWAALAAAVRVEGSRGMNNIPLGIGTATYDRTRFALEKGDMALVYTDALSEARTGAEGKMLGEQGLVSLLNTLGPRDPHELTTALLETIGPSAINDDLTMLVIRPNDAAPRTGLTVALRGAADTIRGMLRG